MNGHALELRDITVTLPEGRALVDQVSVRLAVGRCLGLVGESGSGKSLLLRSIIGLLPAPLAGSGSVHRVTADGTSEEIDREAARGHEIGMIFQEPMRALNPVRRISWTLAEPLRMHLGLRGQALKERIREQLDAVGIHDPERVARSYPHQLSGGMLQRVMIAAALSTSPSLLLCDEPTTALDVTTQAKIIELLHELMAERDLTLVFVSHDLAVISQIADVVAVMREGRLVEIGGASDVIANPGHPYTRMLLASVEHMAEQKGER
ncbi:ABC transporter ATP-binding protein [Nonomuraea sp. NPDC046570]|uniref:ABC transporter ATP-binding protein n=1 Tax=Nonomuraea sp. NPDC046570 TaxID=3155255 RepID=UPI0033E73492